MPKFALVQFKEITGKDSFHQLTADGRNQYNEYMATKVGIPQLNSERNTIMRYMDMYSRGERRLGKKVHTLPDSIDGTDLEFRTEHIRIYAFHLKGTGKIVTLWADNDKSEQDNDIKKFRKIKQEYLRSLK